MTFFHMLKYPLHFPLRECLPTFRKCYHKKPAKVTLHSCPACVWPQPRIVLQHDITHEERWKQLTAAEMTAETNERLDEAMTEEDIFTGYSQLLNVFTPLSDISDIKSHVNGLR